MKIFQNEKGYTLIFTLLIISVIILLFSSFALSAGNQQKQVEKTDENYEVTAIAEMGLEYYRTKIFNLIVTYHQKTIEEVQIVKDNPTLTNTEKHVRILKINSDNMSALRSAVNVLYKEAPTEDTILEIPMNKYFKMNEPPSGIESSELRITVLGKTTNNKKTISAKLNFPTYLVDSELFTAGNGGNNGSSNGLVNGQLVTPPNFPNTIPSAEMATCPPDKDQNTPANLTNITCKSSSLTSINNFQNSSIYYTGSSISKNAEKSNYFDSKLYVNNDFSMSHFNTGPSNLSFFVNGFGTFQGIDNPNNLMIQTEKGASFKNINNVKKLDIYLNGPGNFSSLSGSNFHLFVKGNLNFSENINNLTNSKMEVLGSSSFNVIQTINSELHFNGPVTIRNKIDLSGTKLYSDSDITNSNDAFQVKNSSKVCIRGTYNLVNLEIDRSSNVYILDTSSGTYKTRNTQVLPQTVSATKFQEECTIPGGANPSEPTFVDQFHPGADEKNFTLEIKYN